MKTKQQAAPPTGDPGAMWDIPLEVYANEQELLQGLAQQEEPACTCLFKRFARVLYPEMLPWRHFLSSLGHTARYKREGSRGNTLVFLSPGALGEPFTARCRSAFL